MADLPWRKVQRDIRGNDKFREIFDIEDEPAMILYIWLMIMLVADDDGRVLRPNHKPHTIDSIANTFRVDKDVVARALEVFDEYMMIEHEDDVIVISNFEEYQGIDKRKHELELNRARVNKCRKKDAAKILEEPAEEKEETEEESYSRKQRDEDFAKIYDIYPKKGGKAEAFDRYTKWVSKTGYTINGRKYKATPRQIWFAVKRYLAEKEEANTELQFYKGFNVLLGKALLDYLEDEE